MLPIYERYHDKLFPYSELKGNTRETEETAGNGITKVYIKTAGNKTVFGREELTEIYKTKANIVMLEMGGKDVQNIIID